MVVEDTAVTCSLFLAQQQGRRCWGLAGEHHATLEDKAGPARA